MRSHVGLHEDGGLGGAGVVQGREGTAVEASSRLMSKWKGQDGAQVVL